ncbi:Papain family cysteine protease [Spironucleus salmonicida]|uniref:Papain family cysteine protease n=1 Tax=Spironucleus salmonicida TaxID=348837 RepID=V6LF56_9EUKA|nr:Papain family cysteine protease [Spironucleus salmonicida]|eukprot:EST42316.1 hypothetical protein SS50377_18186 [Spironucleus salmonicida]
MSRSEASESSPLVEGSTQQDASLRKRSSLMYGLSVFLVVIILLFSSLILMAINVSATYDILSAVDKTQQPEQYMLPKSFRIKTVPSVKDQASRGTCWDFATMRFLEERYNKQFNLEKQYLKFSEQAHGKSMIDFCRQNPKKCPDTPTKDGSATDGQASWIYHFNEFLKDKLVPDMKSCPYMPQEGTDEVCPGYEEFIKSSPIKYSIENYKALYQIDDIKKALVSKNSTFPLITELFFQQFFIPCDSTLGYKDTKACLTAELCPQFLQNQNYDRKCTIMDLLTTAEASFLTRTYKNPTTIGAHAMLLVGYNDEFSTPGNSPGGFIVLNSWGPQLSHSAEYFTGEISRRDDDYLCPNAENPKNWVPVDHEDEDKWKLRNTTVLRYIKDGYKPGHFHTSTPSVFMEALDKLLSDSEVYAILKITDSVDATHRVVLKAAKSAQDIYDEKFTREIVLPSAPIDMLAFAFEPMGTSDLSSNFVDQCGYYFIPYDFVRKVQETGGLWFVEQMDVKFEAGSDKMNDMMKEALHEQTIIEFVSHTPWLDDENMVPRY